MGWRSCISTVRTCQKVFASIKDQIDNMHVLSYVLLTQTRLGSIVLWNSNPLRRTGCDFVHPRVTTAASNRVVSARLPGVSFIDRSGHVLGCWRNIALILIGRILSAIACFRQPRARMLP